jgi:hypothetical protein
MGYTMFMTKHSLTMLGAIALAAVIAAPALALDNPMVVDLHGAKSDQRAASATLFESGSTVLVNVTVQAAVPKAAAVTLNDGSCANPGGVAFALSRVDDNQSLTQLKHPLADIASKAKSLVIHQTASETSPAFACGKLSS